jgi:hypothetical protein
MLKVNLRFGGTCLHLQGEKPAWSKYNSKQSSSQELEVTSSFEMSVDWVWVWRESYVTTDSNSASLSWNKAPIWGLRPDINYCLTITVLFLWAALSDERMGLSFVYATGPRECSPSWVWDPLISRPYFTVSDLRLPFSSPPTTRRVTVEVFDPASTRVPHQGVIFTWIIYKNSVCTSQETHRFSATNISQLTQFTVRTKGNTQIQCFGRIQSWSMLKRVVHIITTGL